MKPCTPYSDQKVIKQRAVDTYHRQAGVRNNVHDPYLDRITEREMVPDILHRVRFDENIDCDGQSLGGAGEYLTNVLAKICRVGNYPAVLKNYDGLQVGTLKMMAGEKRGSVEFVTPSKNPSLVAARSTSTGADYKDLMEVATYDGITSVRLVTDVAFAMDEEIQVFLA